jgi:hypothetical protein
MSISLHPRYFIVENHKNDLARLVLDFERKCIESKDGITEAEWLSILTEVFSDNLRSVVKGQIRMERHGTTDKKGDEA